MNDKHLALIGAGSGVVAIVISAFGFFEAREANRLSRSSLKTHLAPEIECIIEPANNGGFNFTVKNTGDMPAQNLSVDQRSFAWIEVSVPGVGRVPAVFSATRFDEDFSEPGKRWIYRLELLPNEHASRASPVSFNGKIFAVWSRVQYLRDTDGKAFEKLCNFYREEGVWKSEVEFSDYPQYFEIRHSIERSMENDRGELPERSRQ